MKCSSCIRPQEADSCLLYRCSQWSEITAFTRSVAGFSLCICSSPLAQTKESANREFRLRVYHNHTAASELMSSNDGAATMSWRCYLDKFPRATTAPGEVQQCDASLFDLLSELTTAGGRPDARKLTLSAGYRTLWQQRCFVIILPKSPKTVYICRPKLLTFACPLPRRPIVVRRDHFAAATPDTTHFTWIWPGFNPNTDIPSPAVFQAMHRARRYPPGSEPLHSPAQLQYRTRSGPVLGYRDSPGSS